MLQQLEEGFNEYVEWKVRRAEGSRQDYQEWKDTIKRKVRWQADKEVYTLPKGRQGMKKVKELKEDFASF